MRGDAAFGMDIVILAAFENSGAEPHTEGIFQLIPVNLISKESEFETLVKFMREILQSQTVLGKPKNYK